jgi:Skp family chaperone for outer membrane proteins
MRTFLSFIFAIFLGSFLGISVTAQTVPIQSAAAPGRIYIINPSMFADEKAGITKFVAGLTLLNKEFLPAQQELQTMADKIQKLATEIKTLQQQTNPDQTLLRNKAEEYDRLQREFKFKQDDAKDRYDKREAAVMGPIRIDIGKAMQEFAKKNGYWMIMDALKMDEAGVILTIDEGADVSKPFIAFYNARP